MKKHVSLRDLHESALTAVRRRIRKKESKKNLSLKEPSLLKGLTPEQKKEVTDFWHHYGIKTFDIGWVDFYTSFTGKFDKRYLPDDIYFAQIDLFYCKTDACQSVEDKNSLDLLFHDVKMPGTVVHKVNDTLLDRTYHEITEEEAVQACKDAGQVIFKPSVMSSGGFGIFFWQTGDGEELLHRKFHASHDWVVQRVMKQHPVMSHLHRDSINTIRILTFYFEHEVHVLSSIVRMGLGDSKVDNVSSGGIACGVGPDGRLGKYAFFKSGKKMEKHPQGAVFAEVTIPNFDRCTAMVRSLALRVLNYSRLVSWDLAIDEEGDPVLIEANLCKGGLNFHQMANGPLFGDLTERVLDEVFATRS